MKLIDALLKIGMLLFFLSMGFPLAAYGITIYQKAQIEEKNRQEFFLDCSRRMYYADCHLLWNYSKGQPEMFSAPLKQQPQDKRMKGDPA